jgi:hypothetical protein
LATIRDMNITQHAPDTLDLLSTACLDAVRLITSENQGSAEPGERERVYYRLLEALDQAHGAEMLKALL